MGMTKFVVSNKNSCPGVTWRVAPIRREKSELLGSPVIWIVIGSPLASWEGDSVIVTADAKPQIPAQTRITTIIHQR
jgi:hypothetical protein